MAIREYYIGSHGPYFVDDTSDAFVSPDQLIARSELTDSVDTITTVVIPAAIAGLLSDAPNDGKLYIRRNGEWEELVIG